MRMQRLLLAVPAMLLCAATAHAQFVNTMTWGSLGAGAGQFNRPLAIAVDPTTLDVFVADTQNQRIQSFTQSGANFNTMNFVAMWGSFGTANGQFRTPASVACDGLGNVFVMDQANNRVQKFTTGGAFVAKWGTLGSANGQFRFASGIACDAAGNVYVADTQNHRIQKFDNSGTFLLAFGTFGAGSGSQMNGPHGVAVDALGNVWVGDYGNNRLKKFSAAGAWIADFGSLGSGNGNFSGLEQLDIATMSGYADNVFVADAGNNRVIVRNNAGTYVGQFGTFGVGASNFTTSTGVALGRGWAGADECVYVVDSGNNRCSRWCLQAVDANTTTWGRVKQLYR